MCEIVCVCARSYCSTVSNTHKRRHPSSVVPEPGDMGGLLNLPPSSFSLGPVSTSASKLPLRILFRIHRCLDIIFLSVHTPLLATSSRPDTLLRCIDTVSRIRFEAISGLDTVSDTAYSIPYRGSVSSLDTVSDTEFSLFRSVSSFSQGS